MFNATRKTVALLAVMASAGAGGAAIAGAAGDSGSNSSRGAQRADENALTGDTAQKVKEAALARIEGGTVLRVETDADHGSAYEAHVRKPDGTEVEVLVNKSFQVTAVNEMRGRGDGPCDGPPMRGQSS